MKTKLLLIFILSTFLSIGQSGQISGIVTDEDGKLLPFTTIYIKNIDKVIYTNNRGYFNTPKLPYDNYTLRFYSLGFQQIIDSIDVDQPEIITNTVVMKKLTYNLNEFEVNEAENNGFNIRKMRAIEGVMITQGKKSESIDIKKIDANKATNLSRQIYAKIPGLNIWESDGAGIQIGLGGRGLNPSRNSNFNTRQNGYDISADALGYPESYYSPPSEAIDEIQMIRGAASLQFGPQFGGLINFKLKEANTKKRLETTVRQTVGSFGLSNTFISLGGKNKNWEYYAYGNFKFGKDWRPNSSFDVRQGYINIKRRFNEKAVLGLEFTKMYYLAQQPGGLTDFQFESNPDTSFRSRNWFSVDWNLAAAIFNYEINSNTKINSRTFGLIASRNSIGYLDQINRIDPMQERNLISGEFQNIGNETRLVHLYEKNKLPWAFVVGARIYKGYSNSVQGEANDSSGPDFYFANNTSSISSDNIESNYAFPSFNFSLFAEHIFNLTEKLSITPGFRYENIATSANGDYRTTYNDLAGNLIFDTVLNVERQNNRAFVIGGVGLNYKLSEDIEAYANYSQNYRSVNFTDMQIRNPNFRIDPILKDERGFNSDIGIRGNIENKFYIDASIFYLFYNDRIGTTIEVDSSLFNTYQYRTNISESRTIGLETMIEADWYKIISNKNTTNKFSSFLNFAYNDAKYINSDQTAFNGKLVELVPPIVLKTGLSIGNDKFSLSYQYSFTKEHYTDATNSSYQTNAVVGIIPNYKTMDVSGKFNLKNIQLEFGINNLTNEIYFTRRAVAYPGPGIIPSQPRNFYLGLQIVL
ncbi:MAG: iron(III) dicitrate transport protein FecA [Crocinitomicaceae bacterium]|nr:iron(III) dicitrate transport protein FecA [Crocinitomicaceae bacterium]